MPAVDLVFGERGRVYAPGAAAGHAHQAPGQRILCLRGSGSPMAARRRGGRRVRERRAPRLTGCRRSRLQSCRSEPRWRDGSTSLARHASSGGATHQRGPHLQRHLWGQGVLPCRHARWEWPAQVPRQLPAPGQLEPSLTAVLRPSTVCPLLKVLCQREEQRDVRQERGSAGGDCPLRGRGGGSVSVCLFITINCAWQIHRLVWGRPGT